MECIFEGLLKYLFSLSRSIKTQFYYNDYEQRYIHIVSLVYSLKYVTFFYCIMNFLKNFKDYELYNITNDVGRCLSKSKELRTLKKKVDLLEGRNMFNEK